MAHHERPAIRARAEESVRLPVSEGCLGSKGRENDETDDDDVLLSAHAHTTGGLYEQGVRLAASDVCPVLATCSSRTPPGHPGPSQGRLLPGTDWLAFQLHMTQGTK